MPSNPYDETVASLEPGGPAPASSSNPYDATIAAQSQDNETRMRQSIVSAADVSPEDAAKARRLALQFGIPPDQAQRTLPALQKQAQVDQPFQAMQVQTPKLASWLHAPENAAVAKDDLNHLGYLEWVAHVMPRVVASTLLQQNYAALKSKQDVLGQPLSQDERDLMASYKYQIDNQGPLHAADHWFGSAVTGAAGLLGFAMPITVTYGGTSAAVGATIGAGASLAIGQPELAPALTAAGAQLGFEAGSAWGILKSGWQTIAADAHEEFRQMRDEYGRPLDPQVARIAAAGAGVLGSAVYLLGGEYLLKGLGATAKLVGGAAADDAVAAGSREIIKRALMQPTVRAVLADAGKTYLKDLGVGASTMTLARAGTILAGEVAKTVGNLTQAPAPDMTNWDARPDGTAKGEGFLGALQRPDGGVMSEYSVGVPINGKEMDVPTLVPTLTPTEVQSVLALKVGEQPSQAIIEKAAKFAAERLAAGKSVYAQKGEQQLEAFPDIKRAENKPISFARRTPGDIVHELAATFEDAAKSFSLGLAVTPALHAALGGYHARQAVKQAERNTAFFTALGEGVTQSETLKRSPEAMQAFLEHTTKDGPVEKVYAPIESWRQYWQDKGVDPAAMAAEITGSRDAYDRAQQTGEDLAIPTARYATKLAGTEHNAFFADELRLQPGEMNGREAAAFLEQQKAAAAEPPPAPAAGDTSGIREKITTQLEAAGVPASTADSYANLYESVFSNLGERAGVAPQALFDRYGLEISREGLTEAPPAPAAVGGAEAAQPTFAEITAPLTPEEVQQLDRRKVEGQPPGSQERRQLSSDPNAPENQQIDLTHIGAAAARMLSEDPTLMKRADALRRAAFEKGRENKAPAVSAVFLAHGPDGPLYNIIGGPKDKSTVGAAGLADLGIPTPETPADTGERLSGDQIRQRMLDARAAAAQTSSRDTGSNQPRTQPSQGRRPAFERIEASTPPSRRESASQRQARRVEHYGHIFGAVLDAARAIDPSVEPAVLQKELNDRIDFLEAGEEEYRASGHDPLDLLRAIADVGGISLKAEQGNYGLGGMEGELKWLRESGMGAFGSFVGVRGVFQSNERGGRGRSIDDVLTALRQEPRFQHLETLNDLLGALGDIARMTDVDRGGTFYGTDELRARAGVNPAVAWWNGAAGYDQSAYHGSPHEFDEFSLQAIGTGEGAQAYGWGLYFAGKREVAEGYRERLAGKELFYKGREIPVNTDMGRMLAMVERDGREATEQYFLDQARFYAKDDYAPERAAIYRNLAEQAINADPNQIEHRTKGRLYTVEIPDDDQMLDWDKPVSEQSPKVKAALAQLGVDVSNAAKFPAPGEAMQMIDSLLNGGGRFPVGGDRRQTLVEGYQLAQEARIGAATVGDGAALHAFNAWWAKNATHVSPFADVQLAPMTGAEAYAAVKRLVLERGRAAFEKQYGFQSSFLAGGGMDAGAKAASEALAAAGVPGIKYLDGFSRSNGAGSSNYVIFDDKLAQIKEFNQGPKDEQQPDLLDTGEAQPRLPGDVGAARDTENATPEMEAPFTLTAETIKSKPKQNTLFQAQTDSKAFRKWFGESKIVDSQGEPIKLYHGTTGNFTTFDRARGNIESDFGAGIYFSNNPEDVGENYAGLGPDMVAKLERKREQLEDAYDYDEDIKAAVDEYAAEHNLVVEKDIQNEFDGRTAAIEGLARQQLGIEHGGLSMPVYLKVENPAIVGGRKETRLVVEMKYEPLDTFQDEDIERLRAKGYDDEEIIRELSDDNGYTEQGGTLIDFIDNLRQAANRYDDGEVDGAIEKIMDAAGYESIGLSEVINILNKDEHFNYYTDPDNGGNMASHEIVRQALEESGFDGIVDNTVDAKFGSQRRIGKSMAGMTPETIHYIAFKPEQIKSAIGNRGTFSDRTGNILEQEKRGSIRFGPDRQFNIHLFANADLSTFLHESGHFFLEVLRDLAAAPDAKPELKADLETLETTLFKNAGSEQEKHERFARAFEAYLMQGDAPSIALRSTFSRFRAWLVGVYRSMKALNIKLDDRIRNVMDRLVASDAAIADAQAQSGFTPIFTDARSAGMSDREFALYRATVEAASRQAQETLQTKLLADVQREQSAMWKARREEIRGDVEQEIQQRPEYVALAAIQRGTFTNGDPLEPGKPPTPMKLNRQAIVDEFGKDRLRMLPRPYIYAEDGGLTPRQAAEMFGFSSGDELLTALSHAGNMQRRIDAETDRRMIAEHGAILLDGTLQEKAQAAVANEGRDAVVRAEMKALINLKRTVAPHVTEALRQANAERTYERRWFEAETKLKLAIAEGKKQAEIDELQDEVDNLKRKAAGGPAVISGGIPRQETIDTAARTRVGETRVRDLRPELFWSAARKAQAAALAAAAKQDFDGAIVAQQQQLLNLSLFREATKAIEDADLRARQAKDLNRPAARARLGKAGATYLQQVDGILDRYEFAKISGKDLAKRAEIRRWVAAMEGEGYSVELPEEVLNDSKRVNYTELSYNELVGVTDGLKQIVHLARLTLRRIQNMAAEDYAQTRDGIVGGIESHGVKREVKLEILPKDKAARTVGAWFAAHTKLATFIAQLDGFRDGGPVWDAIMRPINEAATKQASMHEAAANAMSAILTEHYNGRELAHLRDPLFIPEIGGSLSKEARLAIALNWGNEGNRQRLMENGVRKFTADQVQAILNTLDERDLSFVQKSIDHINSYWPEIEAKQKRVFGIAPEKVDAASWHHAEFGEQKGGYYPIAYDGRLSVRQGNIIDADAAGLQKHANYAYATTKRGYTKAREERVNAPVKLELSVMYSHLEGVIHDLSHHEMLIDVGRLLGDRKVQASIASRIGDIGYREMRGALLDIALGTRAADGMLGQAINYIRSGATVAGIGWNLHTGILHLSGVFNGMARVGPTWVARGMGRVFRDASSMEYSARWVNGKSEMMRLRSQTFDRDVADLSRSIQKSGGWFDNLLRTVTRDKLERQDIIKSYGAFISGGVNLAGLPVWIGGYEKAMAAGETEARAIAMADQVVLDTMGGGQIKDLAKVQRGGPLAKLFTTFYTYGGLLFNQTERAVGQTNFRRAGSVGQMLGNLGLIYLAPAAFAVGVAHAGGDPEEWIPAIGRELLGMSLNTMVLVRELGGAARAVYSKEFKMQGGGDAGYGGPAGLRAIDSVGQLLAQIQQRKIDRQFIRAAEEVGGILFHLPLGQIQRSIDGWTALDEGRTQNPTALITGGPPRKPGTR